MCIKNPTFLQTLYRQDECGDQSYVGRRDAELPEQGTTGPSSSGMDLSNHMVLPARTSRGARNIVQDRMDH